MGSFGSETVFLTRKQREELIQSYLGKIVEVEIDRPIGYVHVTKGVLLHYTVNYGYLPGVPGGDGEELDAYVLGVQEPVSHFTGQVIGAVRRADDNEDKLVVAPKGRMFHQGEIAQAVHFVEQYFDSTVVSLFQKSCGVIPIRRREGRTEYLLLLQRRSHSWSFPKGRMEAGEAERETAVRELQEETGLSAQLLPDFRAVVKYNVTQQVHKQVVLFLGEAAGEPVLEEREMEAYRWTSLSEAKSLLYREYQSALEQAENAVNGKFVDQLS